MYYGPTLAELDRRTRAKLSESGVQFFTPQNVLDWLNEAQDVICDQFPWTLPVLFELKDVKKKCPTFLLPSTAVRADFFVIRLANGIPHVLEERPSDWMLKRKSFTSAVTGTPRYVSFQRTREGIQAELWPLASTALPMFCRVFERPAPLSALTDRTDIPPEVVQPMVLYALWQAKIKDEEPQGVASAERAFEKAMRDLKVARFVENVRDKQTAFGRSMYPTPGWMAEDGGRPW